MSTPITATITSQGLLIPREAFRDLGEIEVVREADRIIVKSRQDAPIEGREAIRRAWRESGLVLEDGVVPCGEEIDRDKVREIGEKLGRQRPLSEDILEERRAGW